MVRDWMTARLAERRDEPEFVACALRGPSGADAEAIAVLMLDSYRGTVDDSGETIEDARREVGKLLSGEYGEFLASFSFVFEDCSAEALRSPFGARASEGQGPGVSLAPPGDSLNPRQQPRGPSGQGGAPAGGAVQGLSGAGGGAERAFAAATLVTRVKGEPFVAFSMTAPAWKRRGLARAGLVRAMNRLREAGETQVSLVVTRANEPAVRLYESLGFAVVLKERGG